MVFETERLCLRKIALEDAPFIFELLNSPDWLKYIGNRGITDLEKAKTYIKDRYFPSYDNGLGNFIVTLKDSDLPIGSCGLYKRENLDYPDIGFAFLPKYVGKGYGYEAATAILNYAFEDLKVEKLYGFTVPYNLPSIKLLEKLGLKNKGEFTLEGDDEELLLFEKVNLLSEK